MRRPACYRRSVRARLLASTALIALTAACTPSSDAAPSSTSAAPALRASVAKDVASMATASSAAPPIAIAPPSACDAPFDLPTPKGRFEHLRSSAVTKLGSARHRARDLLVPPAEAQWLIGKFAYGPLDKDLEDELVHVYVLRGCKAWEELGQRRTSEDGSLAAAHEGADDSGGRVFFQVPQAKALALGRHRVRFVVEGDGSSADAIVEVRDASTQVFVSDIDGTLTGAEFEEFGALLDGALPSVHPDAAAALGKLAARGVLPVYVTARPEWLMGRTRELLDVNAFPRGIVLTTATTIGALGSVAKQFKSDVFARLKSRKFVPAWVFGNQPSDADAYEIFGIPKDRRVYYQFTDEAHGGRRIESYGELLRDPAFGP